MEKGKNMITKTYNFDPNVSIIELFDFINKFKSILIHLDYPTNSNLPSLTIKFDPKYQTEIDSILK